VKAPVLHNNRGPHPRVG